MVVGRVRVVVGVLLRVAAFGLGLVAPNGHFLGAKELVVEL